MERLAYKPPFAFFDEDHAAYEIRIKAAPEDHVWHGWIEFHSRDGSVLRTGGETTQSSFEDLVYWAEGLEPIYFEGAFSRAQRHEAAATT